MNRLIVRLNAPCNPFPGCLSNWSLMLRPARRTSLYERTTVMTTRLTGNILSDIDGFIDATATTWMGEKLIKRNSYGVEILVARLPSGDFATAFPHYLGETNSN